MLLRWPLALIQVVRVVVHTIVSLERLRTGKGLGGRGAGTWECGKEGVHCELSGGEIRFPGDLVVVGIFADFQKVESCLWWSVIMVYNPVASVVLFSGTPKSFLIDLDLAKQPLESQMALRRDRAAIQGLCFSC